MSKKNYQKKHPNHDETYRPRLNTEEKAANHRKASAKHYQRNISEIREKKRIAMAARRAAAKLLKRRWDPPRRSKMVDDALGSNKDGSGLATPPLESTESQHLATGSSVGGVPSSVPFGILDREDSDSGGSSMAAVSQFLVQEPKPRELDLASEQLGINASPDSPTPDERIAVEALASMAQLETQQHHQNEGSDSILSLAEKLSSLGKSSASVERHAPRAEDTSREAIMALNAGRFAQPPTASEALCWLESGRDRAGFRINAFGTRANEEVELIVEVVVSGVGRSLTHGFRVANRLTRSITKSAASELRIKMGIPAFLLILNKATTCQQPP
ncbi:hypothetical protein C8J57DRAFT_1466087 [Mycena rebaudengoi]|nr:hypothetical protein C8J57DRAFT_1466087 [Mycena rebaudengoi]